MNNVEDKKIFQSVLKNNEIKRPVLKNCFKAFISGGLICLAGELIRTVFLKTFNIKLKTGFKTNFAYWQKGFWCCATTKLCVADNVTKDR